MGILDTQNTYNLLGRLNYGNTQIDSILSNTSTNPVQNKVVNQALEKLGLNYIYAILLDTTLTEEVNIIQVSKYNNKSFNCLEYSILLEIPATTVKTEIKNLVQRITGNWQVINVRTLDFFTTDNPAKKVLAVIEYDQKSNVYWSSESGCEETSSGSGGETWLDSYASVPTYPMVSSASLFNPRGIPAISLAGLFPVGTKIQVFGRIIQ